MAAGYWPEAAWPDLYWPDDYWPDYGVLIPYHPECAYADYEATGTFLVRKWRRDREEFTVELEEPKTRLKTKIPVDVYERADYPNIREDDLGKTIPYIYGVVKDIRPVCIDVTTRTFKVAGHAVKDLTGVRVFDGATETWENVSFASKTLASGRFTLSASDWDGTADVAVDVEGRVNPDGTLMDNAADVVEDILTNLCGYAAGDLHAASFSASRASLVVGTDPQLDGAEVSHRRVSLSLVKSKAADGIIKQINEVVGSYLITGYDGKFRYGVFCPVPSEGLTAFASSEVFDWEEETDAQEIVSKVLAKYQRREAQDYWQSYPFERAASQYLQGAKSAVLRELELPVDRLSDAAYVAQRAVTMDGVRLRTYKATLSHRAWTREPGNFVTIEMTRGPSTMFEVLEVRKNLGKSTRVDVRVGNLHGIGDEVGFWTANSPTLPTRFSALAGYGAGVASPWNKNWHSDIKAWARANLGYWTDDNGFADSTDPDSRIAGAWF